MSQRAAPVARRKTTAKKTPHSEAGRSPRGAVSVLALRGAAVQPKLTVNEPGDPFEREADSVAQAVTQSPAPTAPPPDEQASRAAGVQRQVEQGEGTVQRQAAPQEDAVQRQAVAAEETLQRNGSEGQKSGVSAATAATIHSPGAGSPMPAPVRQRIEPHVGADLSGVRVHSGPGANRAAGSLQARAFTHGSHIFLNRAESSSNTGLMAHEATHVVQQGAAPVQRQPLPDGEPPDQRQTGPDEGVIQRISVADVLDAADNVIDIPPGLLQLARDVDNAGGVLAYLEELIGGVVDSIFGGLSRGADTVANLIQNFVQLYTSVGALGVAILSGDREAFATAVIDLTDALQVIVGDAWDALELLLGPVRDFLDGVLQTLDEPFEVWVVRLAGGIWDTIVSIGRNLWNWTADIRESSLAGWAWDDLREELGITGPDTFDGLLAWVKARANDVWEGIKREFSGVIEAIRSTAGTIRDVISVENIKALREMVAVWLTNARDFVLALNADEGGGVASQQDLLRDVLIPAIQAGAVVLREMIIGAGNWVAGLIGDLATRVTGFIDSLRAVPLLSAVPELLDWVVTAVTELSEWAQNTVVGLFTAVGDGVTYLAQFIEPVLNTLINLVTATTDLLNNLPSLISAAWEAIPAWIRDPIKDFVLNQVLGRIPIFGELVRNPEVWARAQETAMNILQQIFVDGDLRGAAWSFFQALLELLHFPTELVVEIINKAVNVFNSIIENPGGFFMNLLGAVKLGFSNFFDHFLTHLLNGVQGWLLGQATEAGINPPQDFSLGSIFQFVLDVLGLNMDLIWERLTLKIGPERVAQIRRVIDVLTGAWEWISIAINEGLGALWERLQERLSELWDQVLNGVIDWITQTIIEKVTVKLLSMLDPTGIMAVVNSVIALYNAIESFIQYLTQMLEIVNKVLDGIQGIVSGAIEGAAGFLESAMADALPVAIGFLANQVGLGRLGEKLREMIEMVRGYVIRAVDWLIDQALRLGAGVLDRLGLGGSESEEGDGAAAAGAEPTAPESAGTVDVPFSLGTEGHTLRASSDGANIRVLMASESFDEFVSQVEGIERQYARYMQSHDMGELVPAMHADLEPVKAMAASIKRDAGRAYLDRLDSGGTYDQANEARDSTLSAGLGTLKDRLSDAMASYIPGEGRGARIGMTIVIRPGRPDAFSAVVAEIAQMVSIEGRERPALKARITGEAMRSAGSDILFYDEYGERWTIPGEGQVPPKPQYNAYSKSGPVRQSLVGLPLNTASTSPATPPGMGGIYTHRGHLVANLFYGINGVENIVPMTQTTNLSRMKVVENAAARLFNTFPNDVFNYKARPVPDTTSQNVPDEIQINVGRHWPQQVPNIISETVPNEA